MTLLTDLITKFRGLCPGIGRSNDKNGDKQVISRNTKGKEEFEKCWPEIEFALERGWPLNAIWTILSEQKKINCSYPTLSRMVAECDKHSPLVVRPGLVNNAMVAYALGYTNVAEYWCDVEKGAVIARDSNFLAQLPSLIKSFLDQKEGIAPSFDKLKNLFVIPAGNDEDMKLFLTYPDSRETDEWLLKKVQARARRISKFFALNGFPERVCKGDETNETVATWFHLECTGGYDFPNYDPDKWDYLSFAKGGEDAVLYKRPTINKAHEAANACEEDKYLSVVNQALKSTPWIDRKSVVESGYDGALWRDESWVDKRKRIISGYFGKLGIEEDKLHEAAAYHPVALIALWEEKVRDIAAANPNKLVGIVSFLDAIRSFWNGDRASKEAVDKWRKEFSQESESETDSDPDPMNEDFMKKARFITEISKYVNLKDNEKDWMRRIREQRIQALLFKYGFVYGINGEDRYEKPAARYENDFVALVLELWFKIWLDEKSGCYTSQDMELFFKSVNSRYKEGLVRPSQKFLDLVNKALKDTPYCDFPEEKPRQSAFDNFQ